MKEYRIKEIINGNGKSKFTAQYRKKTFWGWSNWYDFHHSMDHKRWSESVEEAKEKLNNALKIRQETYKYHYL